MDKLEEKCAICGEAFSEDEQKTYCPDCGRAFHRECYKKAGSCPCSRREENVEASEADECLHKTEKEVFFGEGENCAICGKPFEDDDEKVFCPDCGAAMHKVCFAILHKCPNENDHIRRPNRDRLVLSESAENGYVCGRCGKSLDNGEETVYCPDCGTPVHKSCWENEPTCPNSYRHSRGYDWSADHRRKTVRSEQSDVSEQPVRLTFDNFPDMILEHPLRSPDGGEELTCRGVSQKELLHFLGINNLSTPRFFSLFMNMANTGKVLSINISAWLFAPFYHFYRRMMGPGIILTFAIFILMMPTIIAQLFYMGFSEGSPAGILSNSAAVAASYILAGVRLALLLFNDYFYMRWTVRKILSIREKCEDMPEDEYYEVLEHSGNPKMMYVLGGLSLLLLLVYALNIFLSFSGT